MLETATSTTPNAAGLTFRGVHHLALNTDDMKTTLEFYTEVLGMSHRILVIRDGRIVSEFTREGATPDAVIAAATGAAA